MYNFGIEMTKEENKLLDIFTSRLRQLMYLHDELKHENAKLKEALNQKDEVISKMKDDYKILEISYTNLKQARIISINDSEVKDTKQRLSKLVREVDKCIALLNE